MKPTRLAPQVVLMSLLLATAVAVAVWMAASVWASFSPSASISLCSYDSDDNADITSVFQVDAPDVNFDAVASFTPTPTLSPTPTASPTPTPTPEFLRIVLTWGSEPLDLDAHLSGPESGTTERFHVFFIDRTPVPYANLDVDDLDGFGPETITISQLDGRWVEGEYDFWVHNYSGFPDFGVSNAVVTIFRDGNQIDQFPVSGEPGYGTTTLDVWRVVNLFLDAEGKLTIDRQGAGFLNDPDGFKTIPPPITTPTPTPTSIATPTPTPTATPTAGPNPTFSLSVADNSVGAHSDVGIGLTVPQGDPMPQIHTLMPAGWDVLGGASVPQDALVASGSVSVSGNPAVAIACFNEQDTQGHKVRWRTVYGGATTVYYYWDGDVATGHTESDYPPIPGLSSPMTYALNVSGSVLTNPTAPGEYAWGATFTYADGSVVTREVAVPIATTATGTATGTTTTIGTTTYHIGETTIQYSSVTSDGSTTVVATATAPPAPTQPFLSSGTYYDFTTTATVTCPCTVTLPYDPAQTPNPRIYHLEGEVWVDVTTAVDQANETVTGVVSSLSFFAVGQPLAVGGIVELQRDASAPAAQESDTAAPYYIALAGAAAAAALATGAWRARRRRLR